MYLIKYSVNILKSELEKLAKIRKKSILVANIILLLGTYIGGH